MDIWNLDAKIAFTAQLQSRGIDIRIVLQDHYSGSNTSSIDCFIDGAAISNHRVCKQTMNYYNWSHNTTTSIMYAFGTQTNVLIIHLYFNLWNKLWNSFRWELEINIKIQLGNLSTALEIGMRFLHPHIWQDIYHHKKIDDFTCQSVSFYIKHCAMINVHATTSNKQSISHYFKY